MTSPGRRSVLGLCFLALVTAALGRAWAGWDGSRSSGVLDLSRYEVTFSETFRGPLDVTPWGPSRWIAHTPWHGDFGDAAFMDPQPDMPFRTGPDGLQIVAAKEADGRWRSGLLSSVDEQDRGFLQAGGYFEARMKMPAGPGTWPAFWLVSHTDPQFHVEIDAVEYYGHGTDWFMVNLILWPKLKDGGGGGHQVRIDVPAGSLVDSFHTYGVEIGNEDIVYFLDRKEVMRLPAPAAAKQAVSILLDLGMGSGWPIERTPNPSVLEVDYVKAFRLKP